MRAAIFIDGGYFLNRLKEERVAADLDYNHLAEHFLTPLRPSNVDLLRAYFYHCAPWMPEKPSEVDNRRLKAHQEFVDEIERSSRWQVKLGKLERRWEGKEEYFEQKRVDVMLSVDLVRHSAAGHIQHAILVAGDSDFIPAVAAAKESGVTVSLWGGGDQKTIHKDLAWMVDEIHRFDWRKFAKPGAASTGRAGERRRTPRRPPERKREPSTTKR